MSVSLYSQAYNAIKQIYHEPFEPYVFSIVPFRGKGEKRHHFLTFLKPEILSIKDKVEVKDVLDFVMQHYKDWGVDIGGFAVFSGSYLKKNKNISKNYETLHKISYSGVIACSESVVNRLNHKFSDYIGDNSKVMGGHEFLRAHKELSANTLKEMVENKTTVKLGSGAYAVPINYQGVSYVLLNGFHPAQVDALTHMGNAIIALECESNNPWPVLRSEFIGSIYPEKSAETSFRRKLFERHHHFNIKDVNIERNGVHISPGPIESMYQLFNFFHGIDNNFKSFVKKTAFSDVLDEDEFSEFGKNPHISISDKPSATLFELTEDMNLDEAKAFLKTL